MSAAAAARQVAVPPARLAGWLERFAERHGPATWVADPAAEPATVLVTAADGAVAECRVPFPPLVVDPSAPYGGLLAHAAADRVVGVLLVRLGGYAAGVFAGDRLTASKVGSRQVHGRNAAGGQSQQRFARRREGQVRVALAAAADTAARVLLPVAADLTGLVTGGDRRALDTVLEDPRLAVLAPLVTGPRLDVPDPRLRVLQQTPHAFRAVRILVSDP